MAPDDEQHGDDAATPWHQSTAKVFGASVAAIAGIGLIVGSVMFVSGRSDEPTQAPLNFVDPSFSATPSTSSSERTSGAPTTTGNSSLPRPNTTDIDLPPPPPGETPPPSSEPSTSRRPPTTRESRTEDDDDDSGPTTSRNRPRFNETRTLYPRP